MDRLKAFLHREDNSTLAGSPASQQEIAHAQQQLGVTFHEDYVHFIRTFGERMQVLRCMRFLTAPVSEMKRLSI